MNRSELVDRVAGDLGVPKRDVEAVVKGVLGTIASTLQGGEKVSIPGFATFALTERKARTGRNPRTGETVKIPATRALKFTPSAALKTAVAGEPAPASVLAAEVAKKVTKKSVAEAAPAKRTSKAAGTAPAKRSTKKPPEAAAAKKPARKGAKS